jgi:glutamate/tyrosine decarboxylase-like PLP-dependent enzyme
MLRVLACEEHHGSIDRAIRLLRLGLRQLVTVPTDDNHRISEVDLARALDADSTSPTIVILRAGDLNTGVYDQFRTAVPLAKSRGAWIHVDGAFGLWAASSSCYRSLLSGVDGADSWATDGHKWLNVPYDCGYAFVAVAEGHRASMAHRASYVSHDANARDPLDWNPEWSRRARGFATYAALRQLGTVGVAELVERCCQHAQEIVRSIGSLGGRGYMGSRYKSRHGQIPGRWQASVRIGS